MPKLALTTVLPILLLACGGDPGAPACQEEPWQWVAVDGDLEEGSVGVDAISVTTEAGTVFFAAEIYEWRVGTTDAFGPFPLLSAPDGVCSASATFVTMPEEGLSFVAAFDGVDGPWDFVTVHTVGCGAEGSYRVQLLTGDGDLQRYRAASSARGTSRFAASTCGEVVAGAVVSG